MVEKEKTQFAELMAGLCLALNREPSRELYAVYWLVLERFPLEAVAIAVRRALDECKFMPKPAELREFIEGKSNEKLDLQAIEAWHAVDNAQHRHGAYRHVDFEDKAINATIRALGGWAASFEHCNNADNEGYYRARFLKAYKAYATRGVSDEASKPLAGIGDSVRVTFNEQTQLVESSYEPKAVPCDYLESPIKRIAERPAP